MMAAGPDVAVVAEAEVAAGPDVGVVVAAVVLVVAVAAAHVPGPLPIARKSIHNTRCQCVEETYCMLGKQGYRVSV